MKLAKDVKPSPRGELEISSLNQIFVDQGRINVQLMGRGFTWLDTGTHDSLLEASNFIHTIEKHGGFKVACLEEIAFLKGYIDRNRLLELITPLKKTGYGQYLINRFFEGK